MSLLVHKKSQIKSFFFSFIFPSSVAKGFKIVAFISSRLQPGLLPLSSSFPFPERSHSLKSLIPKASMWWKSFPPEMRGGQAVKKGPKYYFWLTMSARVAEVVRLTGPKVIRGNLLFLVMMGQKRLRKLVAKLTVQHHSAIFQHVQLYKQTL